MLSNDVLNDASNDLTRWTHNLSQISTYSLASLARKVNCVRYPPRGCNGFWDRVCRRKEKNILIIHTKNISKRSKSIQPVKIQYILYKFYQRCMSYFTIKSPYKSIRH